MYHPKDNNNNNNTSTTRAKKSKFPDQNQPPPSKTQSSSSKSKSSSSLWGSHLVKGLTGDRKTKVQTTTTTISATKVKPKRGAGLITDLSCSVVATQVHPHALHNKLTSSQDLFVEIENLRTLLKESKHREFQLQSELSEFRNSSLAVSELQAEVQAKRSEVDGLSKKIKVLENERLCLKEQLLCLNGDVKSGKDGVNGRLQRPKNVQVEVLELRRLNKELQLQKRNLTSKVDSLESQLSKLAKLSESDNMGKIKAEASLLRRTNEDLSKQVEGLQMSRLNEVEELAYLRWVNAQLRNELQSPCSCVGSDPELSPRGRYNNITPIQMKCSSAKRLSVVKKLVTNDDLLNLEEIGSGRRHSISGSKCSDEDVLVNRRRQSDGFMRPKEVECWTADLEDDLLNDQNQDINKALAPPTEIEKRALRILKPPPRPSSATTNAPKEAGNGQTPVAPPPPPPPPLPPLKRNSASSNVGAVQRAPQVVEFYHSLMKRDTRRDSIGGAISNSPNLSSVKSNMIGEIENRSSYLLAIKADVETQGEFVKSLIREVNNAIYKDIDDVVEFVKWLDDELCFLVDERAVLKHFDWPEKKADTLREAAFGYKDLKKLELEVAYYRDDPRLPCDLALGKMVSLSEKIERTIYSVLRTRESLMRSCKEFQIPTEWMLDSGIISKVKLGSVKLAKKYMNRVATELQSRSSLEKDVALDYMLLQGVRFAFRIHQFAGGFDAETMQAFEQLRKLAHALDKR